MSPPSRAGHQRGQRVLIGETWWLRYRELPDRATGKRRRRTVEIGPKSAFKSEADMHLEADRIMERLAPARIVPGRTLSFAKCCERFESLYFPNLATGSQRNYRSIISTWIEPGFRGLDAHEITAPVIQQWLSAQARAGIPRKTILSRFGVLQRIVRRSSADGIAAAWPPRGVLEFPRDRSIQQRLKTRAFSTEQMDLLIANASPLWFKTLLAVLRFTGARIGEALALTWPNVELGADPLIRIVQSASDGLIGPPKTGRSNRDIPIAPPLAELLRAWRKQCPRPEPQLVFPGRGARPLTTSGVRLRHLRPLLKRLELPALSCHGFRHGACYALLEGGGNPADVSNIMGHADLRQTSAYAQSRHDGRRAAVLGASLLRKSPKKP